MLGRVLLFLARLSAHEGGSPLPDPRWEVIETLSRATSFDGLCSFAHCSVERGDEGKDSGEGTEYEKRSV